jgi:hypothetical protein
MTQVHRVAIVTPLTVSAGAVLCPIFIHALALEAMVNYVPVRPSLVSRRHVPTIMFEIVQAGSVHPSLRRNSMNRRSFLAHTTFPKASFVGLCVVNVVY